MGNTHLIFKLFKGILYAKGVKLGTLDGYERLVAAIFGTPDRVPVLLQPYIYAMHLHGLSSQKFFREPIPFIHASYNTVRYFGVDAWSPVFDLYNIEAEALGQELIWGVQMEPAVNKGNFLIKEKGDLAKLRPPKPGESGRMPFVLLSYRLYHDIMKMPPIAYCCSPFTLAVLVRGLQKFLMDMLEDPQFVHDLMEFLSMEVVVPWIRTMIKETGTSMVVMSDAQASPPIISPKMIREFCLPYIEKVIRATSTPQCTVVDTATWGEGRVKNPREVLDIKMDMMRSGNKFHCIRPYYLLVWQEDFEKVGIPPIRAYAEEKKICLMLNIQPILLGTEAPQMIVETVRRLIREGAGTGRFAITINMIPINAPVENVHVAVAAVKQFGHYPISADLDSQPFQRPTVVSFAQWVKKHGLPVED